MCKWTDEQMSAIDKRNSNILVSASAGSGKTAVLTTRVIKRVMEEEIDIDKLLVVTFTNAAALKLKEDLLKKLKSEYMVNVSKRVFIKRQMKLLNRANISTIHSFCLNLIRTNFEMIGIDPEFKVCDESNIALYKAKALNAVIEEEYAKENNDSLFLLLQLFKYKEDELCYELLRIYGFIQSFEEPFGWLKLNIDKYNIESVVEDLYQTAFGKNIYEDTINELKLIAAKIDYNVEILSKYDELEKIKDVLIEDKKMIEDIIISSKFNWNNLYTKLQEIEFKKFPTYKGQMQEKKDEIVEFRKKVVKDSINKIKNNIYGDTCKILEDNKEAFKYLNYIYDILLKFDEKYKQIKLSKNVIDFSDIEHLAYELLTDKGEPTNIAKNLKEKFVEVYTDEYQDTSFIQEAILDVVSSNDNRFMVGDIKQSIYRFRQASPEIFNYKALKYKLYNGDDNSKENTKIILAKNFRSRPEVIDFVNLIFEKIMTMRAGNADYTGEEVLKCGRKVEEKEEFNKTKINIIDLKKEEKNDSDEEDSIEELKDFEIESKFIAQDIKKIVKEKNVLYKDIVILLRNVTNRADILENALKDENIPVFSDVSSSVFDSEEIKLVLSFLRVLDNKYQDVFLTSIMYSIVGKFSLDELVKIRNLDKKCSLYDCLKKFVVESDDNDLVQKVDNFLNIINAYEKDVKNLTLSEVLIKLFTQTGIYYEFILDENYKQRKANLDLILDITLKYEKENGSFLNEYIDYIDNLSSKNDSFSMQAKIIGENENVVRIMTIHKSKGLEFPVVILADTSRRYSLSDFKNKIYLHQSFGVGINIVDSEYKVSYPGLIKHSIKNMIENESRSEELRLLYVALTRAKDKLIIYGTTKDYLKLKKNLFIMKEDEKVDPYIVLKNDSYLKNILMAIEICTKEDKKIYDVNVINYEENIFDNEDEIVNVDLLEEIKNSVSEFSHEDILNEISKIKSQMLDELLEKQDNEIMQRVSVTSLKSGKNSIVKVPDNLMPSCLDSSKEDITPARKGTLIHFILQILDFNKISSSDQLKNFINEKIEQKVISVNDSKYIDINSIMDFINSDIGKEIKKAKFYEREKEFILKNNSFTKSTIQGVIDLYYETDDGKVILVDFKTDNITNEQKFIELYKKQLDIYKEAIEKLEKKSVYKKYIYSFNLGKKIEVV